MRMRNTRRHAFGVYVSSIASTLPSACTYPALREDLAIDYERYASLSKIFSSAADPSDVEDKQALIASVYARNCDELCLKHVANAPRASSATRYLGRRQLIEWTFHRTHRLTLHLGVTVLFNFGFSELELALLRGFQKWTVGQKLKMYLYLAPHFTAPVVARWRTNLAIELATFFPKNVCVVMDSTSASEPSKVHVDFDAEVANCIVVSYASD